MKSKTKLFATIMAMCLVITLGVIGILAVKTLNMSVGGNISFTADGVALTVSPGTFKTTDNKDYSNIISQTGKLQGFSMSTDKTQTSIQGLIDSWKGLELVMDSKGDAVLHFSVKNDMQTPLYVYIETTLGQNTNNNMTMTVSPNGTEIAAGATTNFTVTFAILDTSINAGLTGFNIKIDFTKEQKSLLQTQYKVDETTGLETTEIDYYYVEMGTYNGQPVRWRYVADSTGTSHDGTSTVSSLSGYYVLETVIPTKMPLINTDRYDRSTEMHTTPGYTKILYDDYGLSDVRAYLTNTGSGGFMEALGISTENRVYKQIESRSLVDLYETIGIDSTNTSYSLSLTGDKDISAQSDKFWLMSFQEASEFGLITKDSWSGNSYWIRYAKKGTGLTPIAMAPVLYRPPSLSSEEVIDFLFFSVRPCFKIA